MATEALESATIHPDIDAPVRRATFGDQLRRNARRHPDKLAVVALDSPAHDRRELTYRQLDERANQIAHALADHGLETGDVVAIMGRNSPELITTFWACAKLGAAVTGLNYTFLPGELHYQLSHSGASVLVCEDSLTPTIDAIAEDEELDPLDNLAVRISLDTDTDEAGEEWLRWSRLLAVSSDVSEPEPSGDVSEHTIGLIPYTSGTEALPKAVLIPQRNYLVGMMPAFVTSVGLVEQDVWYYLLPMHTIAGLGLQIALISLGNTIVLPYSTDPQRALDSWVAESVTCSAQTPTFFLQMIKLEDFVSAELSQLRRMVTYGGTMPRVMFESFAAVAPNMEWVTFWSQSELAQTPTVGRFSSLEDIPRQDPSWIGQASSTLEIRVVDDDGNDATHGELLCRSPGVMRGYLNDPEKTAEVLRDGWLHTGDIVEIDADRNLFFRDRRKDMIKSGGLNVSSVEVERAIYTHDGVMEVAVVGLDDEYWGQAVTAFVTARPGEDFDGEEIRAWCRDRLAPFKVPKTVNVVDSLPKDSQGKTLKRELRGTSAPADA
ncbi:class I adenylate-forming enzyme family protein [Euzebya tangerina]|uniref:class I adenylate-forming enzyme family protein n=1 Tax=Euzebya tangerina TaxID=591198 RepID=UPI000E3209B7|nr:class I adenylate-forming enzyme family protein [Euzebya tangerina]